MNISNNLKTYLAQLITIVFLSFSVNSVQAYWVNGFEGPPKDQQHGNEGGAFNLNKLNEGYLTYTAATEKKPIPWKISKGHSAFLKIYIPPYVSSLNVSINSEHLAGSQSIMFKNFGEYHCGDDVIFSVRDDDTSLNFSGADYLDDSSGWEAKTGASTLPHKERDNSFFDSGSCVVFGFHNADNPALFQLQTVRVTYTISDLVAFEKWGNPTLPTANFTASISKTTPFTVDLISTSVDLEGMPVISHKWEWWYKNNPDEKTDDNNNNSNNSIKFPEAGTYVIQLTVTDSSGQEGELTQEITVEAPPPPEARFTANAVSGVAPLTVNLDASSSTGGFGDITYIWNVQKTDSDETILEQTATSGEHPPASEHTFETEGVYTITLTMKDSEKSDTTDIKVTVSSAPIALPTTFTADTTADTASLILASRFLPVKFSAVGGDNEQFDYKWLIVERSSEGGTEEIEIPNPLNFGSYEGGLVYEVKMQQKDKDKALWSDVGSRNVYVLDIPPTACFTVDPVAGYAPVEVSLDASCSSDIMGNRELANYEWFLDDEKIEAYNNKKAFRVSLSEEQVGSNKMTLKVTDANGGTSETTRTVLVASAPEVAPALEQEMSIYAGTGEDSVGSFYETVLVNGKLSKAFSKDDHVDIMATIVPKKAPENVLIQLAFQKWEDFYWYTQDWNEDFPWLNEKTTNFVNLAENKPLHIKILSLSGEEFLSKLGSDNNIETIDIYVGYQSDGQNIFNTTPISLTYKSDTVTVP